MIKTFLATLVTSCLLASGASAASSDWHPMEGGRIRLVTSGLADADGSIRGVLQIDLKPGWKTYWRDPGSSGVPPSIDVSSNPLMAGAEIEFPAPEWHADGSGSWAGYDEPVSLPVSFAMRASGSPGKVDASVFLGICETLCVPVSATLSVDPGRDAGNAADASLVEAAWAVLPQPATAEFGASLMNQEGNTAFFEVKAPDNATQIDLFVAGADGYMFGHARPVLNKKAIVYGLDVITRPKEKPAGPGLHYTVVTPQGSVSGLLPYF